MKIDRKGAALFSTQKPLLIIQLLLDQMANV
jgi:hypothetical protein